MIQLSKILSMFVVSQTKRRHINDIVVAIFVAIRLKLSSAKIKGLSNRNGLLHSCINFSWSRCGAIAFLVLLIVTFHYMTKRNEICNAVNNSICTATSAHETRTPQLTGNPFIDLSLFGFDLHCCNMRYYRERLTGEFNISGRITTGSATNYENLIFHIVKEQREYKRYVSECRLRKRQRNWMSWLNRHPEYAI